MTEQAKPLWQHPLFKSALKKALDNDENTFELDGGTYTIRDCGIYWCIAGPKGMGQVEKAKVGRKGAEWY